jgi:hypothetical protein
MAHLSGALQRPNRDCILIAQLVVTVLEEEKNMADADLDVVIRHLAKQQA